METGLAGKVVIVTGGASNIGRGIVLAFAREGAKIAIADIDEEQGKKTAARALELGAAEVSVVKADVTREAEADAMVGRVLKEFGRIDVLVSNLGRPSIGSFLEQPSNVVEQQIDLNLRSTIRCAKAVLPHMVERGSGRVVNIGSEAGRSGDPHRVVYSACKGGVIALTKALAREVGSHGITVNCVCPHKILPENPLEELGEGSMFHLEKGQYGRAMKPLFNLPKSQRLEAEKNMAEGNVLERMGRPSDIGPAVVFLASEAASYITGQTLSVNGGDAMI